MPYMRTEEYVQHKNSWRIRPGPSSHKTQGLQQQCSEELFLLLVLSVNSFHQNNEAVHMALSFDILHHPIVHLWHVTTSDTNCNFIPDNTGNTINNFGEYIYSKAYSQTRNNS